MILKYKDLTNMKKDEIESRLKELKLELIKANVTVNKQNAKTKEIKRAISRIYTFSKLGLLKKK